MVSPALADYAPLRLCLPVSRSNLADTNRCTIPKRFQPCRKAGIHLAETISPAQCPRNRLHLHLLLEILPATCWPSIFRRDEIHRPKRMFFLSRSAARRKFKLRFGR